MKSVVGQANEEFIRDVTSASTTATNITNTNIGRRMSGLGSKDSNITDIMKKADLSKKNLPSKLPAIDLTKPKNISAGIIPKGSIKAIANAGPIKP